MRKTLALIAALLLLIPTCVSAYAAPASSAIYDAEDLLAIRNDPSGSYTLESDIDMSGISWKPLPFRGN